MQHYLSLLQKYVSEKPEIAPEIVKQVHDDIAESQAAIEEMIAEEIAAGLVHHEGIVYKEGERGAWKVRHLALENGFLILSLAKGKEAAAGGDRSRKIPMEDILSASPINEGGRYFTGKYGFAISTRTSPAIVMATDTIEERNVWVSKILQALGMN